MIGDAGEHRPRTIGHGVVDTDLPRFPLLDGPSPSQPLPRFSSRARRRGGDLDQARGPAAAGVRWQQAAQPGVPRGAALADGADTLVTSGRRWSNHARLTAAAGARAGLAVHLVLSGPADRPTEPGERARRAARRDGPPCATDERAEREARSPEVVADLRAVGSAPVRHRRRRFRGDSARSARSWRGSRSSTRLAARGFVPDDVVLPSATGGTQAGLLSDCGRAVPRPPSTGSR